MRDIRGLVESLARTNFLFWQGTSLYHVFDTSGGMRLEEVCTCFEKRHALSMFRRYVNVKGRQDEIVNATLSHSLL